MKFSELESIMSSKGVYSLAQIARYLKTTPQAVSNWKSRNQVPYHIVAKISNVDKEKSNQGSNPSFSNSDYLEESNFDLSDLSFF